MLAADQFQVSSGMIVCRFACAAVPCVGTYYGCGCCLGADWLLHPQPLLLLFDGSRNWSRWKITYQKLHCFSGTPSPCCSKLPAWMGWDGMLDAAPLLAGSSQSHALTFLLQVLPCVCVSDWCSKAHKLKHNKGPDLMGSARTLLAIGPFGGISYSSS